MKKLRLYFIINLFAGLVYSALSFSFKADVSVIALPFALAFTAALYFFAYIPLVKNKSIEHIVAIRRFLQYEPFAYITAFVIQRCGKTGKPFGLDLACVIVWLFLTVLSFIIGSMISEKKMGALDSSFEKYRREHPITKPKGTKRIFFEIGEWIDALVQAVYTILLLNIFLFQLYEIPSESMVPTFLVKDRVIVFKTPAGPKFPLSDVGLPYVQNYKRGDIVVFHNPHYEDSHRSEVKSFLSQFVYMCTLTLVKTNTDDQGELKYDPLVKRVAGLPGEQLIMMDGSLYARTKDSDFVKVEQDNDYAAWNLNALSPKTKYKIQDFPLSQQMYDVTLELESERRALDLVSAKLECESLSREFALHAKGARGSAENYAKNQSERELNIQNIFSNIDRTTALLMSSDGGSAWFDAFLNEWHRNLGPLNNYKEDGSITGSSLIGENLYTDSCFRLNVMTKLVYGRFVLETAKMIEKGIPSRQWQENSLWTESFEKAQKLYFYIVFMDQRNMPLFPANDENGNAVFIPDNNFFMMGDNRYNSLDMRHSYSYTEKKLDSNDAYSVTYTSNIEPIYVNKSKILGKASYRWWPLSRAGVPGKSARN